MALATRLWEASTRSSPSTRSALSSSFSVGPLCPRVPVVTGHPTTFSPQPKSRSSLRSTRASISFTLYNCVVLSSRTLLALSKTSRATGRGYLSDSISIQWLKGHPERSDTPPSAWSRHQWGIYIADALTKIRDISSLSYSLIPTLSIPNISLPELLFTVIPPGAWQWAGPDGTPPLGNLRTTLSHHRVLAYLSNRDHIRASQGAPSMWLASHQSVGEAAWLCHSHFLRNRAQALHTLWDLRWHGENRAAEGKSADPQVSACPISHRYWTQAHVLCECPGTSSARMGGLLEITIASYQARW